MYGLEANISEVVNLDIGLAFVDYWNVGLWSVWNRFYWTCVLAVPLVLILYIATINYPQLIFTCSKSAIEKPERGVKC